MIKALLPMLRGKYWDDAGGPAALVQIEAGQ
ncbi:MAG: hypothetical protein AVDCRST_MAG91-2958 [uncultured Sphingomonadaceae bacterium]|uniref:Uncharacterized protein n=1 Tax=uncultured Sphingomonadaceae bacterium TaxID=169976 RepID=A0A6J4TSJ7_9SPHN|nr:MAG: hypothetical protein AVDCRST_MAG91-2958 [uncultured Sphingomonadaceae bacterium]